MLAPSPQACPPGVQIFTGTFPSVLITKFRPVRIRRYFYCIPAAWKLQGKGRFLGAGMQNGKGFPFPRRFFFYSRAAMDSMSLARCWRLTSIFLRSASTTWGGALATKASFSSFFSTKAMSLRHFSFSFVRRASSFSLSISCSMGMRALAAGVITCTAPGRSNLSPTSTDWAEASRSRKGAPAWNTPVSPVWI